MSSERTLEIRSGPTGMVALRAKTDSAPPALSGYGAVFNKMSQNLGGYVEMVAPGAFTKSLADAVPVMCRYNHDDNGLLGTTEGGTLSLAQDGTGLAYTCELPDTQCGRDVQALAARGDLRYSSFAFYTLEDEWGLSENDFPMRTLLRVQLVDVAPVNNPAYRDTTVGMRSLAARTGLDPADLAEHLDEIRALLTAPTDVPDPVGEPPVTGQRETHPTLVERTRTVLLQEPSAGRSTTTRHPRHHIGTTSPERGLHHERI